MSDTTYTPAKVWTWETENGGNFANINRPIAGATHDKALPVGEHPIDSLESPSDEASESDGLIVEVVLVEVISSAFLLLCPHPPSCCPTIL